MPVDRLVIDREKWGKNALLNTDGTMCCLGHLSVACGIPPAKLRTVEGEHLGYPDPEWKDVNEWARREMTEEESKNGIYLDRQKAADINDCDETKWADKERMLIEIFARNGIQLSFIGPMKEE